MSVLKAGDLDRRVRIERPVADDGFRGAGSGTWTLVAANVPAGVRDMLPSRGEQLSDGMTMATRPARLRMRYRTGITADMRFVMGTRIMQIVSGPAEIGRREGVEFVVEDYSGPGNAA